MNVIQQLNAIVAARETPAVDEPSRNTPKEPAMRKHGQGTRRSIARFVQRNGTATRLQIAKHVGLGESTVRGHLKVMLEQGTLVIANPEGSTKPIIYGIPAGKEKS